MTPPVQVLGPREVPLGGPRAMTVRRTLPARERSFVGAWCFADHYGPDDVSVSGGMDVAPHPHCGLATVSWLFSGEVEHRDSLGTVAVVRPGEVNLMTAGRGISHSEVSTAGTRVLHGAQLWVVLPSASAEVEPRFEHHVPEAVHPASGVEARVFVGSLWGSRSPVRVETALLGVEVVLGAGASVALPVPDEFEVGVLVDRGSVDFAGARVAATELGVVEAASGGGGGVRDGRSLVLTARAEGARVLVLAGEPFGEEVVMWWNFVGRSHDEVAAAREAWESGADGSSSGRFGRVEGYEGDVARIPAPGLPGVRLRSRGNRDRPARPETETEAEPMS
ncbi:pirin family protein [Phycicoccus sp. MAQZ13P-2]|uniref:pirin family protein n=1 Tax=Phycicoccus mangrovi TaxID=2840470 RepID=UPI001BFFF080|nr:pirin family protein [Phycicoccus mangrovi]MBT9255643.1 pirin family protein [Phycicoccus mangrovi]MBT9275357.1 pirin family protein [Phycicoccus mangrovi]